MASVSSQSQSSLNMQMEDVAEKLFVHMNLTSEELNIFALKDHAIDGKYYRLDFQTEGNAYMASRFGGGWQPGYDPSQNAEDQFADYLVNEMLFRPRQHYISTDFTGAMKAAVKSRKGGYFNLAEFRFKDTADEMKERVAIKLASTQLGTLAKIQTTSSATITLQYAGYNAASTQTFENGARFMRRGLVLDATAGARGNALRQQSGDRGRKVLAVDLDFGTSGTGPTITLNSAPASWTAGDYLVIYNERQPTAFSTAADYNTGLAGLIGIIDAVDDGGIMPYYGELQRSSYPTLKALVFANPAGAGVLRPLTQQIINQAYERKFQISGGSFDVLYSTFGVQRQFVDFLTIQGTSSTANDNPMRFDQPGASPQKIGFNSFEVFPLGARGKLTFMPSRHAPHHMAFLLERSSAILLHDGPPAFIDYDGNTIRKVVGKDEATADWVWRATGIVCREPWKNARIDDLAGDHMTL